MVNKRYDWARRARVMPDSTGDRVLLLILSGLAVISAAVWLALLLYLSFLAFGSVRLPLVALLGLLIALSAVRLAWRNAAGRCVAAVALAVGTDVVSLSLPAFAAC
jgi:hypothetical protein